MSRTPIVVTAAGAATACVLVGLPLLMVTMLMGGVVDPDDSCSSGRESVVLAGEGGERLLNPGQLANASVIVSEGRRLAMPEKGIVIALAVASQESRFLNYANDGVGHDLGPDQRGIEKSLELPHEAVGSDHGSLGLFQQQWPWWGRMVELMDPATAARKFYAALLQVEGWELMPVTVAGQAVQRSAHPQAYEDDVALAVELLGSASGTDLEQSAYFGSTGTCLVGDFIGEVVMPLGRGSSYVDQASFGAAGARWEANHTGTDFSAACGTPVLAATDGAVTIRTDQAWAGMWLVEVESGPGGVVTWYAHMQRIAVEDGEQVSAGQPLGEVGAQGNATGCHLHFEVHPGGGAPIDPTQWLAGNVGAGIPTDPHGATVDLELETTVLMTSNVPLSLSDATAARQIRGLLSGRPRPDVLMLQAVKRRDVTAAVDRAPGRWSVWQPTGRQGGSAIVWNADKFSVSERGVELGFKGSGLERWMPWALLESDSGILPVVALHLPGRSSVDAAMHGYYRAMTEKYAALISALSDAGYPPIVGGNWSHQLDVSRSRWGPVPVLQRLGMTTNWIGGAPCKKSFVSSREDGFAYNPGYLQVVDQGCSPDDAASRSPVWVAVAPTG